MRAALLFWPRDQKLRHHVFYTDYMVKGSLFIRRPSWEDSTSDASHCSFFGYFSSITILVYQLISWSFLSPGSISLNLMYTLLLRTTQRLKSPRSSNQGRLLGTATPATRFKVMCSCLDQWYKYYSWPYISP